MAWDVRARSWADSPAACARAFRCRRAASRSGTCAFGSIAWGPLHRVRRAGLRHRTIIEVPTPSSLRPTIARGPAGGVHFRARQPWETLYPLAPPLHKPTPKNAGGPAAAGSSRVRSSGWAGTRPPPHEIQQGTRCRHRGIPRWLHRGNQARNSRNSPYGGTGIAPDCPRSSPRYIPCSMS